MFVVNALKAVKAIENFLHVVEFEEGVLKIAVTGIGDYISGVVEAVDVPDCGSVAGVFEVVVAVVYYEVVAVDIKIVFVVVVAGKGLACFLEEEEQEKASWLVVYARQGVLDLFVNY